MMLPSPFNTKKKEPLVSSLHSTSTAASCWHPPKSDAELILFPSFTLGDTFIQIG